MRYRKLKADGIFDGKSILKDFVLVVNGQGVVESVVPAAEAGDGVETFKGILTPGFVNCHCHLELSHMQGVIPPRTGMVNFLLSVMRLRGKMEGDKQAYIQQAADELWQGGTVAVGDICNTTDALDAKGKKNIYWHNFVELINLRDETLDGNIGKCQSVLEQHIEKGFAAVLTPHAPYSISAQTFAAINVLTQGKIISVHNQESAAENELFRKGSGDFLKLYKALGMEGLPLEVTGKSSLQTWLPYFTNGQTILLVHNTFIEEEDILFANEHAQKHGLEIIYCLCPNANLYIENSLPPVALLQKYDGKIVLGTDSYSSNWQLSIAAEIKVLHQQLQVPLETLLQLATANGAEALRQKHLGFFQKGAQPGVVLLQENFSTQRIM